MATFKHTLDIPFASTVEDFMHMYALLYHDVRRRITQDARGLHVISAFYFFF